MKISNKVKELILAEASALKNHLTREEKDKLNLATFDPTLPHGCVYGQVTGECHSTRAKHLLNLCAVPYSSNIEKYVKPTENDFHSRKLFKVGHHDTYSALEFTLFKNIPLRKTVIDYLKNNTKSLEL